VQLRGELLDVTVVFGRRRDEPALAGVDQEGPAVRELVALQRRVG
jgi:hypothetical protein